MPAQATLPRPSLPLLDRYNFGPVIDGSVLPAHPFDPAAPAVSDDIPILVGGTKDESAIFLAPDEAVWNRTLSEDEFGKRIAAVAGDAAPELVAYYKRRDPAASPADRLITALTMSNFTVRSNMLAERKAARGKAPVWVYDFAWESPAFGGRLKSCHSVEVPFVFDTLDVIGERAPQARRAGAGRPRLADLGRVRPHRQGRLARLHGRQPLGDGVRRRLQGRRRSRRRGPSALEQGRQ